MKWARNITMVMLALSVMLAGVPVPVQAAAPCPMMEKMSMKAETGKPCHCPCCDKDQNGDSRSCNDSSCTEMNSAGGVVLLDAPLMQPIFIAPVVVQFDTADASAPIAFHLTQDRPPKTLS